MHPMPAQLLSLKDQLSTWVIYAACMAAMTWVCFDDLAHLRIVTHDTDNFRDNVAISEDFSHFFPPQRPTLPDVPRPN